MNGDPVFYADPSGADGTPVGITPEAINTWHFAGGNQMFTGAGNLSSGDHMFGASGDEFWNNEIAYTGGELAWSNYFADNRTKASIEVGTLSVGEFLDQVAGFNHALNDGEGEPGEPPAKKAPNLKEANKFYNNNKNPKAIYKVAANSVDLNFVNTQGWIPENQYTVQTLYNSKNGLVFGKLKLIYKGNNQVKIMNDKYDFNMEFSNPLKVSEFFSPRNLFTSFGNIYAGNGVPFTFVFSGLNIINYNSTITQVQSFKQYP
jgi:hypothetical protein